MTQTAVRPLSSADVGSAVGRPELRVDKRCSLKPRTGHSAELLQENTTRGAPTFVSPPVQRWSFAECVSAKLPVLHAVTDSVTPPHLALQSASAQCLDDHA